MSPSSCCIAIAAVATNRLPSSDPMDPRRISPSPPSVLHLFARIPSPTCAKSSASSRLRLLRFFRNEHPAPAWSMPRSPPAQPGSKAQRCLPGLLLTDGLKPNVSSSHLHRSGPSPAR